MKHYQVTEKQLLAIFNQAANAYTIYKPQDGNWVKTPQLEKMFTADKLTTTSVKEFLMPNSEKLFNFAKKPGEVILSTPLPASPLLVLGALACDLQGIKALDELFKNTVNDELYAEKRQHIILVGFACQAQDWACFCTQLGVNPQFSENGDLFVSAAAKGEYILSVTSARGEAFLSKYLPTMPPEIDFTPAAARPQTKYPLDFPQIKKILDESFHSPLWENIARKCINCGICTYLCPTCHCFDIFDEERRGQGIRGRCYDSCMFPGFTKMAGGHNPRANKAARFRQRYMHKYKYFVDNFHLVACCGCGRCIRHCPVNVDVRQNLTLWQIQPPKERP